MSRRDPKPGRKDATPPCPTAAGGGRFDFVLANPPFNVNAVDPANCELRSPQCESCSVRHSKFDIRHFLRFWVQLFHSAMKALLRKNEVNLKPE